LEFESESKRKLEQTIKERERQLDMELSKNAQNETNKMNINERVASLEKLVSIQPFISWDMAVISGP
jgi:hypothetical protein